MERVIFVHGTGATAPGDDGTAWWQRGGPLWREFDSHGFLPEAFIWSGLNSERARRTAGDRLRTRLEDIWRGGEHVHLVGHSHGGSVIRHALDGLPIPACSAVLSWATVGTPVLRYSLRRGRVAIDTAVLAIAFGAFAYGLHMLRGVHLPCAWRDAPGETVRFLSWLAVPAAGIVTSALSLARGWWGWYRIRRANFGVDPRRYLSLWSTQDEPILGLGASGSFSLRVLGGSGAVDRIAGGPLNQLVNNVVSRSLQGSDIEHQELRSCATSAAGVAHRSLPPEVDDSLIRRANEHAASLGAHVRDILVCGSDPVTGFVDLQRGASLAFTFKELVHTSYFDEPACRELLLHHAGQHSAHAPATALPAPLAQWYVVRLNGVSEPASRTLPANRVGFVVASVALIAAAFGAAVATSLQGLSLQALEPTTARYQLQQIVNSRQFSVALASVAHVDKIEAVIDNPQLLVSDPESVGADLQLLDDWLMATVGNGHTEAFIASALDVERGLAPLAYEYALPFVLGNGTVQQVREIGRSALFPGPPAALKDKVVYYPALEHFVWIAGERQALDHSLLDAALARCPPGGVCASRVRLAAARALARAKSPLLEQLAPLPHASEAERLGPAVGDGLLAVLASKRLLSVLTTPFERSDRDFVIWLVRHAEWKHLSGLDLSRVGPLPWLELEPLVRPALDAQGENRVEAALFMLQSAWEPPVPTEVTTKVRAIALTDAPTRVPLANPALLRPVLQAMDCSIGRGLLPNERFRKFKELALNGQRCDGLDTLAPDPQAAIQELDAARTINDYLQSFAHLGLQHWPAPQLAQVRAHLMQSLKTAACSRVNGRDSFAAGGLDRRQLASALKSMGPGANGAFILAWFKFAKADPQPCGPPAAGVARPPRLLEDVTDGVCFELANWLAPEAPDQALVLMQLLSGTRYGPVSSLAIARQGTGVATDDYIRWFYDHAHWVDALFISAGAPDEHRAARRAAAFKLASCERRAGRAERAQRLLELALRHSPLARAYAAPSALLAEAEYHAAEHDWRQAMEVCEHCTPAQRLAVMVPLIADLSAEIHGNALPASACESVDDKRFEQLFKAS